MEDTENKNDNNCKDLNETTCEKEPQKVRMSSEKSEKKRYATSFFHWNKRWIV